MPDENPMRKAEKEIGANIPEEMKGLDTEDLGDTRRPEKAEKGSKVEDEPPSKQANKGKTR